MANASAKVKILVLLLFLFNLCLSLPSYSWEKKTADRIVATALASLPGEIATFLEERSTFFHQGLQADPGTVRKYAGFTRFETTGYSAEKLGGQIALLQKIFPAEHSAYMAYRLGVLTRLIMDLNSPFATATTPEELKLKRRFMEDVEAHLAELKYMPGPPRAIDVPKAYVATSIRRSDSWAGPVRSQYLSGKGYNFIVQHAASKFYDKAIHSIIDVLYTIGSGRRGEVPGAGRYGFYMDSCSFYLKGGMGENALGAYRKVVETASSLKADRFDSIQDAVDRYELILQVLSLEDEIKASGIEVREPVGNELMEPFFSELSHLAKRYMDSGQEDESRVILEMCLRENYLQEWALANLREIYGLDKLENLDVEENAWKIYLEANGFETTAGRAYAKGQLWAANNSFARAAALYSAIPESVRDMRRASRSRIDQIIGKMRMIPPEALLSEELFQAAIESLDEGEVDSAVRDLQLSQRWGADEKTIGGAIADAESLQLFMKGRDLYQDGKYEEGVKYFRKLTGRFPRSPFAGPARKMIDIYEKRRALASGKSRLLLKGAYEASFVGDEDTVFDLCDDILASAPDSDLRDRARLLIAVAWYQSNQKGYLKIERVFRDLLKDRVLEVDDGKFTLRKRIDFYFGLKDPFPEMDLEDLDDSLLANLDLGGEGAEASDAGEAADNAIARAEDEIETAEGLISSWEGEGRDMDEARSLLDEASDRLANARDEFDEGAYEEAKESAEGAFEKAADAGEKAEEIMGEAESLREEARGEIDEAESSIEEAESALENAEEKHDIEFDWLRSDLDRAKALLDEARNLFNEGDYEGAEEKALDAIEKAKDVREEAEELEE